VSSWPYAVGLLLLGFAVFIPLAVPAAGDPGDTLEVGYVDAPTVVDAILAAGEYPNAYTDVATTLTIHAQYSGNVLGIAIESPGRGWIAISLGAVLVGSNYTDLLTFALDNGTLRAIDQVDHGWEVHMDLAVGGTDDIIAAAATQTPAGLTLEFQIPLDSADDNDHHFRPNETYPFSLAYNATSTDLASPDTAHSTGLLIRIGPTPQFVRASPTVLRASSVDLVAGEPGTLAAVLRDADGNPVANHPVEFYLETTYGPLYLGLARTNSLGKAALEYEPRAPGTWTFFIAFRGSGQYLPSNQSVELVVLAPPALPAPLLPADTAIAFLVFAVVGGIWGTYLFVFSQLAGIRRAGRAALTRPPSTEAKGGESHPNNE